MGEIKVIAFDADDTLWENETYFKEAEDQFAETLIRWYPKQYSIDELFRTEMKNLSAYGYGAKSFTLSMIETLLRLGGDNVTPKMVSTVLEAGDKVITHKVECLPEVEETLKVLNRSYKLVMITKGDLLHQQRKLRESGLSCYFDHIEIISEKDRDEYHRVINLLGIKSTEFMMVGNSLKSDIIPPLEIGATAIYIPFEHTWQHEHSEEPITDDGRYYKIKKISELVNLIHQITH